jgi:outer membrane protein assembly factor BamB
VFVNGDSGYLGYNQLTVAYNATTGAIVWRAFGAVTGGVAFPVAVSPDGSTVFAGSATGMVAYNAATGAVLWSNNARVDAIAVSSDSNTVFVTGQSATSDPAVTEAFNAVTGALLWQANYGQAPGGADFTALDLSPHGSVLYAAGSSGMVTGESHPQLVTIAYNAATGVQEWVDVSKKMTPGSAMKGLAVSPSGSAVFIAEEISAANTEGTFLSQITAALDPATGATMWSKIVRPTAGTKTWMGVDPYAIAASPDGSAVYVTGYETLKPPSGLRPNLEYHTIGYAAATGQQLWTADYQKEGEDIPDAITVSPDSSEVFVTGRIGAGDGYENDQMVTVAYSS